MTDKLLAAIRVRLQTTTELYRVLSSHGGRTKIQATIQTLVNSGLIRGEVRKTGGRDAKVWHVAV